jgi:hypothetical protein
MTIYWRARQIPELSHLSAREARKALANCWRKRIIRFPHTLGIVLFWVIAGQFFLALYIDARHGAKDAGVGEWLLYSSAAALACVSTEVLLSLLIETSRSKIRDYIRGE